MNIIGLMTGTSMDGIDISLVKTNGIDLIRLNENYFHEYSNQTKKFLSGILKESLYVNLKRKKYLDEAITEEHYLALKDLDIVKTSDFVGFHGQTIYHNPSKRISIQLGDPKKFAKMIGKNIIADFRAKDIEMFGQGAPLAPIYHQYIIEKLNLELPSCILNIGGVANLTYWDGKDLIGFDTGPGNALMDDYAKKSSDKFFDQNGFIASKGNPNDKIINKFLKDIFFLKQPPKSLDRNSFQNFYNMLLNLNLPVSDTMSTLAKFTIESIFVGISLLPQKAKNIIVTGGGSRNQYMMKCLKKRINTNFIKEDDTNLNFDYIESELIAFLSARSIYNLPITFPSTTGVKKSLSGGTIYYCS